MRFTPPIESLSELRCSKPGRCKPLEWSGPASSGYWEVSQRATGGLVGSCWYPEVTLHLASEACAYGSVTLPRDDTSLRRRYVIDLVCEGHGSSTVRLSR